MNSYFNKIKGKGKGQDRSITMISINGKGRKKRERKFYGSSGLSGAGLTWYWMVNKDNTWPAVSPTLKERRQDNPTPYLKIKTTKIYTITDAAMAIKAVTRWEKNSSTLPLKIGVAVVNEEMNV